MSVNIYQIHIKTDKMDELKDFLVNWLEVKYGSKPDVYSNRDSFFPFFENEVPTIFALCKMHDEWITVLHDSYSQLMDLTSSLSDTFQTLVIHTLGQSTVDTYTLNIFEDGELVRKIDFGEEYSGIEQYGEPLSFEKGPLGRSIVGEGGDSSFFDYNDMQEYCLHFNIDILIDPFEKDGFWEIIQIPHLTEHTKRPHNFSILKKVFSIVKKRRHKNSY